MPPRRPPDVATSILFIVFLWFVITSHESPSQLLSFSSFLSERYAKHQAALERLNISTWGDFSPRQSDSPAHFSGSYLNLTGFREEDGFAWDDLARFRKQCHEWSRRVNPPMAGGEKGHPSITQQAVWHNATGFVKGHWVRKDSSANRTQADYNLTAIAPDYTWQDSGHTWFRNITGREGKIAVDIVDNGRNVAQLYYDALLDEAARAGGLIRTAKASLEIEDVGGSGRTWEMRLHGVQWPRTGVFLMTTTSEKFDGIFGLPHLSPGPEYFRSSQTLLNETLATLIRKEKASLFADVPSSFSSETVDFQQDSLSPSPRCEFVLFAQVHPLDNSQLDMKGFNSDLASISEVVGDIERELRFPNGAPIRGIPDLQMSAILWSPDCAFFLETKGPPAYTPAEGRHLVGSKIEVIFGQIRFWVLTCAGAFGAQVFLLKEQMRESFTPSTLSRISYSSISMMVILDGLTFAAASMWALEAGITFLESLCLLFAAFMSMSIGGIFLAEIHKVQEPQDRRRTERESASSRNNAPVPESAPPRREEQQQQQQQQQQAAPSSEQTDAEAVPRRAESPPIIIPSDQDIDAEIAQVTATNNNTGRREATSTRGFVIGRLATTISIVLCFFIFSMAWSSRIRSLFTNIFALVYLSFWLPQIHRNVMRNCRRALSWRFMIGQSVLRLAPLAYFYLREDNFLFAEPDRRMFLVFCGWLWVQLWVLAFQDVLGPRFGIPKSWTPEAWDYHPILREDNLEDGSFPIGLLSSLEPVHAGSTGADGEREDDGEDGDGARTECAICFDVLEVPVVRAGEADAAAGGVAGVLTRRNYMVTPCRHVFHSACLESWLRYRLKCPICRDDLPPL
ncbi:transmembrane E3 ubiquitin-protein ligase [Sodiomyces alkalinus F11]|uniref:DSC E3 ubiquitin ligase complex subunit A n=1 Tax=Sodiomyces alkalinus (strain CBS 110278 / VKM F-3762 / F11) TaxID=1314773 RepID=A0A3N2Q8Z4_SODAK|nr:transmembrane E3 ubiquitin-protein ligase [Sodiomyces alkalinus F11]ROT43196.1 transmembrane E3 ubiquitin-protein ligase [Sodiomyces alkalinus F11]